MGGRVYLKQILQAFPLSALLLARFLLRTPPPLLFTSHRSPLSERLEQATSTVASSGFEPTL